MNRQTQNPHARALVGAAILTIAACSGFAADYPTTVKSDNPKVYYRLNDATNGVNLNLNSGSAANANATNLNVRAFPGAIVGDGDFAQFYNTAARSIIPFNPALNPTNTTPFTMEVWLYPASDQNNPGMAPIANRYAYSGVDRQGWVIFQRSPNANYTGEPRGWNFRMFRGSGSATGLDLRGDVDYQLNKWMHMVVVYDPVNVVDATLTMYINGVEAGTTSWTGSDAGYVANTDHGDTEHPNGPSGLAFGSYNNTGVNAEGQTEGQNAYFGGIDEFAFYTNKLTPEKILAHYQNATNAARTISYSALIQQDSPVAYYRLNELPSTPTDTSINMGRVKNAGDPINSPTVQWNSESSITEPNDRSFGYHHQGTAGSHTQIPFLDQNNPSENIPMSIELWVRADDDRINPGAAVINNRKPSGDRTGWVIFQRSPNTSYGGQGGHEGVGYNLRMYSGSGGASVDVTTSVPYAIGEWQHLVFNWLPDGGEAGGGTLTCFVNGQQAGAYADGVPIPTESIGVYRANTNPTDDGTDPADLTVGSYNARGGFGQEFTGKIDEVAIYTNMVLSAEQILAHYEAATNLTGEVSYGGLVLTAPTEAAALAAGGPVAPQMGPATYLRFNDVPKNPAANAGTLGSIADAAFQAGADNNLAGPVPSSFPGFADGNLAGNLPGDLGWLALNNPDGLNFNGQITLEAWIKPAATQGAKARIITHGPELLTFSPAVTEPAAPLVSPEVFLNIEEGNYVVGSSDGTNTFTATAAIPDGDLGSSAWIHLAGVYDGANWKLYRNGAEIASAAATTGSLVVTNAEWAVGSSGLGWSEFFSGGIDEVAIYNTALTPAKILAHYNAATVAGDGPTLEISIVGNSPRITFTGGLLQEASALPGEFNTINGATSPYTPPAGSTMKFYRVLAQ